MELNYHENNLIVDMVQNNDKAKLLQLIYFNHTTRFSPYNISEYIMKEAAKQGNMELFKDLHTNHLISIPIGAMKYAAMSNNPFMFDYVYNFSPTHRVNARFIDEVRDAFATSIENNNKEMVKHITTSCDLQAKTPFVKSLFFELAKNTDRKQNNDEMVSLLKNLSDVNLF